MLVSAVVLLMGANLFAQEQAPKQEPKEEPKAEAKRCCKFMAQFEFTKEQKPKAEALHAECVKEGCSAEAQAKFFKAVKKLLTPEQIAACKASCEKAGIKDCPICCTPEDEEKPEKEPEEKPGEMPEEKPEGQPEEKPADK